MLKILFILPNLGFGGAEKVTLNLIKKLNKKFFCPVLFLFRDGGELRKCVPPEIEVIIALKSSERVILHLPKVLFKLRKAAKKADLLFGALELTPTYLA